MSKMPACDLVPRYPLAGLAGATHILVLAVAVLLATVPFLAKPFHVDDLYYLQVARQILSDPARPYSFELVADGMYQDAFEYVWSPPFFCYVLAAGVWLFGEREWALHGLMAAFLAIAAASSYALAVRFTKRPLVAAIATTLNPLVVAGQNVMLDVPMLSLGLLGLALFVRGVDRNRLVWVSVGGFAAGLAVVTKYPALFVPVLMGLYAWLNRRVIGYAACAIAAVPMLLWCIQNMVVHGVLHFPGETFDEYGVKPIDFVFRAVSVVMVAGSGFFVVWCLPFTSLSSGVAWWARLASLAAAAAWVVGNRWLWPSTWHAIEYGVFLATGLLLVVLSLGHGLADDEVRRDRIFLLVWFVGALFLAIWSPFVAVRHLMWSIPAAAILVVRIVPLHRSGQILLAGSTVCLAAVGLAIAQADYELASIYRDETLRLDSLTSDGEEVYYAAEGGFAYYASELGFRRFGAGEDPMPKGAIIYIAKSPFGAFPSNVHGPVAGPNPRIVRGHWLVSTAADSVNYYAIDRRNLPWHVGSPTTVIFHEYRLTERLVPVEPVRR